MFARAIEQKINNMMINAGLTCEVVLPNKKQYHFGKGKKRDFRFTFHSWRPLRYIGNEFELARCFVDGDLDIEGDLANLDKLRTPLNDKTRTRRVLQHIIDVLSRATRVNKRSIDFHYNLGTDFFHSFIDSKYHFYSHGLFRRAKDTLEQSSEHKLANMFKQLNLKPGQHLLDIGGGWGGVADYCCPRGIKVTMLTIADEQYDYVKKKIAKNKYDAAIIKQDFLAHRPKQPYDAIVIYGVIEHIPYYRKFAHNVWSSLKPGGGLYMDGSAAQAKYQASNFTTHYIWRGTHSFMCVQDVIQELLFHGMEVMNVESQTRDYSLTMLEWAKRFEKKRDFIVERWGEQIYRSFLFYLWGGHHTMEHNILQAYGLTARRRESPLIRPGNFKRFQLFLRSLR